MKWGMEMQLPEMVRLVGKISGEDRVYMEDYVYTYLHDLKQQWEKVPIRVALFGHVYQKKDRKFYMIYGAASVIDELADGRDEEQVRKDFFAEYELIGYVNIYGNKQEWPGKKNGYYIFYESNESMQNYLINCFERKKRKTDAVKRPPSSFGDTIKRLFYGAGVLLLTLAVTAINDYDKMHGFVETAGRAVIMAETGR